MQLRTRTKVLAGFGAALAVAVASGLAGYLASRAIGTRLEEVTASQFPVARGLNGLQASVKDGLRFLNTLALSRQTAVVLHSSECIDCHGDTTIFDEGTASSLSRMEAALKEIEALPKPASVAGTWPTVRDQASEWLGLARSLKSALDDRNALAASPELGGSGQASTVEQPDDAKRERDADRDRTCGAPENHPFLQMRRHVAGGETDDQRIVASEHQVNDDDGQQGHQEGGGKDVHGQ